MDTKEFSILVIDDEESLSEMFCEYLSSEYTVRGVGSVEEALDVIARGEFNVIVSDINLPGASGFELCRFVRQFSDDVPVILMSARSDKQYVDEAYKAGAFEFLSKPFDFSELSITVERALIYRVLMADRRSEEEWHATHANAAASSRAVA
jgi:DNA-binding NtrC family response regulator